MRYPEFPVVSFLCIFILLLSLPAHIKARSVSTLALIAWMIALNLIRGVNSLVWAGNIDLKLMVWCDITTKLMLGYSFAVPAAVLCILRHLENVASTRQAQNLATDKRKRQQFEFFMCFGIPIVFMALHYVVQGHRFDLFENFGCSPTVYFSIAGLCLVYIPPLMISLTSLVYAAISVRHILRHRSEFASRLQSNAAISPGRYFRLMALAVTVTLWDTGVNSFIIYYNSRPGLRPWISWDNVHSSFTHVQLLPESFFPQSFRQQLVFQWWIVPVCSFVFFIFLGFGKEAMLNYRTAFTWFRHKVFRQNLRKPSSQGIAILPSYRPHASHVNVTFPNVSDNMSEAKAWEALTLKMPEDMESSKSLTLTSKEPISPPTHDHSTSVIVPEYASFDKDLPLTPPFSDDNHNHLTHYETVPVVLVTKPSNAALRDDFSPATFPRPTFRRSMSPDLGITVSPPYFPDASSASRYHEEVLLARDSQDAAPVSDTPIRGI